MTDNASIRIGKHQVGPDHEDRAEDHRGQQRWTGAAGEPQGDLGDD